MTYLLFFFFFFFFLFSFLFNVKLYRRSKYIVQYKTAFLDRKSLSYLLDSDSLAIRCVLPSLSPNILALFSSLFEFKGRANCLTCFDLETLEREKKRKREREREKEGGRKREREKPAKLLNLTINVLP